MESCPAPLLDIVRLLEGLPEQERRELLIEFARRARGHAPKDGDRFAVEDVRHDAECTDTVGIHLLAGTDGGCRFRISFGPEIQTLTKALGSILCEGMHGAGPAEVLAVPDSVIERIAGTQLVRLRSRTIYYLLHRMQEAVRRLLTDTGRRG